MKLVKQCLGKVAITVEKDYWDINKDYDKLTIVSVNSNDYVSSYISKKPVPAGISIDNSTYWGPIASKQSADYSVVIFNLSKYLQNLNHTEDLVPLTIADAVEQTSDNNVVKQPNRIITFIKEDGNWEIWKFKSKYVSNWSDLDYWQCSYYDGIISILTELKDEVTSLRTDYNNIIPITEQQVNIIVNP